MQNCNTDNLSLQGVALFVAGAFYFSYFLNEETRTVLGNTVFFSLENGMFILVSARLQPATVALLL